MRFARSPRQTGCFGGNFNMEQRNKALIVGMAKSGVGAAKGYGCGLLTLARVP